MESKLEQAMRDRVNQGFVNWNKGYDAWLEWCDTLYEPDAHYNVQGKRLTLQEYKDMMKLFMAAFDIELGQFYNMMTQEDWIAIRYEVHIVNRQTGEKIPQNTMEFVNFKDNPDPIGARVVEGWAISDNPLSDKH